MKTQKIFVGGWFQRTTLHLSEIYDFVKDGYSPLDLDKEKLKDLKDKLELETVELKSENLEYIRLTNKDNIDVKIYEDGLIILGKDPETTTKEDIAKLTSYYEEKLSPGISYIFSLGAPIPKELANIKVIYPYFIVLEKETEDTVLELLKEFNQTKHSEIKKDEFEIYRGDKLYIINNKKETIDNIEKFVQEQVFIREFKGQMHRYLNLHRIIWEKIADVKEKGEIKGNEVGAFKEKIESYNKTINLIGSRINQMGSYINTRASIAKNDPDLTRFIGVIQFKYETLSNTLGYIKEIWSMTRNYVNSSLAVFSSIQSKSTEHSVKNLTVITSMGVGATLIGLFTKSAPTFTLYGVGYFLFLAIIGYSTDKIMARIYRNRMYKIKNVKIAKNIK
ncbi:hypothetical protein ACFLY7_01140 [Patescibacteria group bacterium]